MASKADELRALLAKRKLENKANEAKNSTEQVEEKPESVPVLEQDPIPGNQGTIGGIDSGSEDKLQDESVANSENILEECGEQGKEGKEIDSNVPECRIPYTAVGQVTSTELAEVVNEVTVSPEYEPLKLKMRELEAQLEAQIPGFALTLRDIHQFIAKDPNAVTILTEEEIGTIVSGLERHSGLTIVASKTPGKSKGTKSQPVTADML